MHERKFLLITCFLVVLAGVPSVYSIVRDPNASVPEVSEEVLSQTGQREPASVKVESEDFSQGKNRIKARSVVMDYNCDDKKILQVEGTLLRLKGNGCLGENLKDVSITNTSNGFTGSMIFLKNKGFTTDFMEIQEGENKFQINGINEKGQSVSQTFTVHGRMPASVRASE